MKIYTSQVKGLDLEVAVRDYIAALKAHTDSVGVPMPVPVHPFIEHCIKRVQYPVKDNLPDSFEPDYELIDDAEYT